MNIRGIPRMGKEKRNQLLIVGVADPVGYAGWARWVQLPRKGLEDQEGYARWIQ